MQGAQNFPNVYGSSLQRFPSHANPVVTFSHFGGAAKFTDPHFDHFAYYLAFKRRIKAGSLGKEDEPFTAFPNVMNFLICSIRCHETRIRQ